MAPPTYHDLGTLSKFPQTIWSPLHIREFTCLPVLVFTLPFILGVHLGEVREECVLTTLPNPESYLLANHDSING